MAKFEVHDGPHGLKVGMIVHARQWLLGGDATGLCVCGGSPDWPQPHIHDDRDEELGDPPQGLSNRDWVVTFSNGRRAVYPPHNFERRFHEVSDA